MPAQKETLGSNGCPGMVLICQFMGLENHASNWKSTEVLKFKSKKQENGNPSQDAKTQDTNYLGYWM